VGLTVQFDGGVYERLAGLAEKREESIGSLVREAVAAYLARRRKS
jgi:predicted transcriptional regulator